MSELEQETLAPATGPAAAASGKPASTPQVTSERGTAAAAEGLGAEKEDETAAAEEAQIIEAEQGKRATKYQVLKSASVKGPWEEVGEFTAAGQAAAKRAGLDTLEAKEGEDEVDPQKTFFLAVPITSYVPQKPTITTIVSWD